MGKKKNRDQGSGIGDQKAEKQITGSGADVVSHKDEQGRVKCKCIVPCVWRGYRDEGDTAWIEKDLIEKDAFIRMHFKAVDGVVADAGQDGDSQVEGEGEVEGGEVNADGANGNGNGGSDNADGADGNSDGADLNGEGQVELELN